MKKLALLALVLLVPGFAFADGDPGIHSTFGPDMDVIAGGVYDLRVGPANYGNNAGATDCGDPDTFCVHFYEANGWVIDIDPPEGECHELDVLTLWYQYITVEVPCDVSICDVDTVIAWMYSCNELFECDPSIPDCYPDSDFGVPKYTVDTVILHVVESPPALFVLQDSLTLISQGQTSAYVPFGICNGDPCAPPTTFDYTIDNMGHIPGSGTPFPQTGSLTVVGGTCDNVYAVVDAGASSVCDLDTLTIIVWDQATGTTYDTCVQLIHVVEPVQVPLFTAPVVTILVLAMILAAAVIMRKRAASRA
jgi:hypothetical protein